MTLWLTQLLRRKASVRKPRPMIFFRPRLEVLEDRVVPALTYHGGPIIPNVQAQAVFLGSNWTQAQTTPFNAFLHSAAGTPTKPPSAFLNLLGAAGFSGVNGTVGSGNTLPAVIDPIKIPVTNLQGYNNNNPLASANYSKTVLFDSQIQTDLDAAISTGATPPPSSNGDTLYTVFVEPNVVVDVGDGENSINTFSAYHNFFTDSQGATVVYSVTPYAGAISGSRYANSQAPWLSAFDSMTMVTTHELAESVTDPQLNAWYDASGNEVGDIVNGSTVYLNGNAVQRVSALAGSQDDYLALTPPGATAGHSVAFSLSSSGVLTKQEAGGRSVILATGVAFISPQGIDDFGQPMIDFVFTNGKAYEYHDFLPGNPLLKEYPGFFPTTFLSSNVQKAVAGQGVSYVLLTNGELGEYVDPNFATQFYGFGVNPTPTGTAVIASGVTSLTGAGLDALGGNVVNYTANGVASQWDDVNAASTSTGAAQAAVKTTSQVAVKTKSKHSDAANVFQTLRSQAALFTSPAIQAEAIQADSFTPVAAVIVAPPSTLFSTTNRVPVILAASPLSPRLNHVDGGGSEGLPTDDAPTAGLSAVLAPTPLTPANLSEVPLFGPLLKEAAGQAKTIRSMVPSELWRAAPAAHSAAPAVPKETPESKAPEPSRLRSFTVNVLLAVFGFGLTALTREERGRRQPNR
jgi:hypothetical protein